MQVIQGFFKAQRPEAGLKCKPEALIKALDFFNVSRCSWPAGLQLLQTTMERHAKARAREARCVKAWQQYVAASAAQLLAETKVLCQTVTFSASYRLSVTRPMLGKHVHLRGRLMVDTAQPPAHHLVFSQEPAIQAAKAKGWQLVEAMTFRSGNYAQPARPLAWSSLPAKEQHVYEAFASLCRAEHLILEVQDSNLCISVAGYNE